MNQAQNMGKLAWALLPSVPSGTRWCDPNTTRGKETTRQIVPEKASAKVN